jgi:asparaginyl-tRNA synthetase
MFEELTQTDDRYKVFPSEALRTVAMVEASLLRGARKYLNSNGYLEVVVPHIVSASGSCEIIETLLELQYFTRQAFLTQTAQLYLEALVPFLGGKVYTFGPSFRAEQRVDSRHLVEFSLLELEFEGNFEKLLTGIEELFINMIEEVLSLPIDNEHLAKLNTPFKRFTYEEAINTLDLEWGNDIYSTDEQELLRINDNQPYFITHFPKELKYFNMKENDDDPRVVNSADFIVPYGGECVGAAEREHNPSTLLKRLKESSMYINLVAKGGDPTSFDWYINAYYRYPYKLHSGFGMGLNRVTKFVLQLDDIRQSTIYPVNRATIY